MLPWRPVCGVRWVSVVVSRPPGASKREGSIPLLIRQLEQANVNQQQLRRRATSTMTTGATTTTTTTTTTTPTTTKPIIIGIAGGTGAGKSTFAKSIYHGFRGGGSNNNTNSANCNNTNFHDCDDTNTTNIAHLSHDDYYKDLSHLPIEERALINFDHPDSLDSELLIHHLHQLSRGISIQVPRYDFKRHCRYQEGEIDDLGRSGGRIVESKRVILVEGILILSISGLVKLMDLKVFVDAPHDIRLMRRIRRDSVERGRQLSDILSQYELTVRPMHDEFVEPSKKVADIIVPGHDEDEDVSLRRMELAMRVICNHLRMETTATNTG